MGVLFAFFVILPSSRKFPCVKIVNEYWLLNVTINNFSVTDVMAHRCAGGLKKKLILWSAFQCHRHLVRFFNVPVQSLT